jgi:hypothetical protein
MTVKIEKDKYIKKLQDALNSYYESKGTGEKEQIAHLKGICKGMINIMGTLKIIDDVELKNLVIGAEFEVPTILRTK